MILSNAKTTNALLAGKKTCTRRVWSERTARAWVNAYQGDAPAVGCPKGCKATCPFRDRLLHSAWDKCSFIKGAKKIADIRLTQSPYQERRLGYAPVRFGC